MVRVTHQTRWYYALGVTAVVGIATWLLKEYVPFGLGKGAGLIATVLTLCVLSFSLSFAVFTSMMKKQATEQKKRPGSTPRTDPGRSAPVEPAPPKDNNSSGPKQFTLWYKGVRVSYNDLGPGSTTKQFSYKTEQEKRFIFATESSRVRRLENRHYAF